MRSLCDPGGQLVGQQDFTNTGTSQHIDQCPPGVRSLDCGAEGAQYGAEGALVHGRKIAKFVRSETGVF